MKRIFLLVGLFVFINAESQINDSLKEMEATRSWNESWFENVVGKVLPDFTAKDLTGKTYTRNIIKSTKVTFINFWFVSCAPCIAEIPNLNRLYDMMKDSLDVQFFAITWESEARAREAVKKYGMRFPVLLVSYSEARQLIFERGFPTSMVLDKEGRIRSILSGGAPDPGSGWTGFESYWKQEIGGVLKGDTLIKVAKLILTARNNSGIMFIDSMSRIQSIDALTNYFNDQSLFIDLWASWCLPCREDFKAKNSIDSFLANHKIARVFISLDNPKVEAPWKKVIYQYELTGYHLLAGKELVKDLKQKIYKNRPLELPRYVIVKNGKIVELNAFRPSDDQKLIKQLTEKLL